VSPASRGVLEQRCSHERPDKSADHRTDDWHWYAHDCPYQTTNQRSPPRPLRPAVFLGVAEADPRLEHLTQNRQPDDDEEEGRTQRLKIGEPAVADNPEQDDPETWKPEGNEQQADEAADDNEEDRRDVDGQGSTAWLRLSSLLAPSSHQT